MSKAAQDTRAKTQTENPVDELQARFADDMLAVNACILEKMDSHVPLIQQLATYLIAAGGKRIRPLLTLASTALHDGDMARAQYLATCVEFIHTATLLHDDVVDESEERRGQAAANTVFGNQASVLVGDFLFSRAFQLMVADGSLDVLRVLSEASAVIAQGEVMQLTTANNIETTMDDYLEVVSAKTAALFAAACEIGPIIAEEPPKAAQDMASFGMNLGIAFQIIDDALDYASSREKIGKTVGDDFREGKITAPVLFAMQHANEEEMVFWTRTLSDLNQTERDLKEAQNLIEKHEAIQKSKQLAEQYAQNALKDLSDIADHSIKNTLIDILDFTINREY